MKKKWSIVLACLIISVCVCNLAACSGGETETHTHTPCNICGLCTDSGCPGASSERCPGHTVTPPVETPELKEMGTYFSGVKTVTVRDTLLDENGVSKSFDELLDRQIDVLAQDLIYRLTYVYGYNETDHNRISNGFLELKNGEKVYEYNSNKAKVNANALLTNETIHVSNHSIRSNVDVSCIDCYNLSLSNVEGINLLLHSSSLYLSGAIEGRYLSISRNNLSGSVTDKKWIWTAMPSTFDNYAAEYKCKFKMAIVQLLNNTKTVTAAYENELYDNELKKISILGFSPEYKSKLVNFIYESIIGNSLIETDNLIRNKSFKTNPIIDENRYFKDESASDNLNSQFFKGYNIVIPAIVEQALSNTFENTDVSIYPSVSRNSVSVSSTFTNLSVTDLTQGIVLMPKANTPMTKLAVAVQGQAGQTATLSLKAVIGGTEYPISQSVTFTGEKQTVEIDLSSVGKAMGAYNGNTHSYTDNRLFGNTDLPDTHGDNYILLNLSGANGNCTLSFNGLYDK